MKRATALKSGGRLRGLVDLDQIATGIGKNRDFHRSLSSRVHRKPDPLFLQSLRFGFNIIDLERRDGDSLLEQRFLKRLGGGIGVGLKHEFHVRVRRR